MKPFHNGPCRSARLLAALCLPAILLFCGCGSQESAPPASGTGTPLHEAAAGGNPETVKNLVQGGADINARDQTGMTPLHHAAAHGHGQTVSELLKLGADATLKDNRGLTARHHADENGHSATALLLPADGPSAVSAAPPAHPARPSPPFANVSAKPGNIAAPSYARPA